LKTYNPNTQWKDREPNVTSHEKPVRPQDL